jgi:D-alanyl-D-alanine carboxypeptidase
MSTLDPATSAVTAFAERYARHCSTPGVSLALTDANEIRATVCVGFSDVEVGTRVTPSTAFAIGSITKTMTAMAALQLRDRGLLDLDAPIDRYLPWFRLGNGRPAPTSRELLTHTAGLPSGGLSTGGSRFELVHLAAMPYLGPAPGWSYSNVGYQALGYALEEASSVTHAELIACGILRPLGMLDTFAPAARCLPADRLAAGYQRPDLHPAGPDEANWRLSRFNYAGNESSLAATAADLAKLVRVLIGRGTSGEVRVLAPESAVEMLTGHAAVQPGMQYGYGVYVYRADDHLCVAHSGNVPGYKSMIIADLTEGTGIALLTNGPGDPAPLARYALTAWRAGLRGRPVPPPPESTRPGLPPGAGGRFSGPRGDIVIRPELHELESGGVRVPAIMLRRQSLYARHPRFEDFCFSWTDEDGIIGELFHGYDSYIRVPGADGGTSPVRRRADLPGELVPFTGHYRSYSPWLSNFHVVERRGQLALLLPNGRERLLCPGPPGVFGIGGASGPDYLWFDAAIDGVSLRCSYSGVEYFRAPWSAGRRRGERATAALAACG